MKIKLRVKLDKLNGVMFTDKDTFILKSRYGKPDTTAKESTNPPHHVSWATILCTGAQTGPPHPDLSDSLLLQLGSHCAATQAPNKT